MITKTAAGLRLAVTLALGLPACAATAQYKQDHLCVDGSDRLCPTIPADLDGLEVRVQGYTPSTDRNPDPDTAQQINFDYFGWQSFVALNWPADGEGRPSGDILGDDKSPRVWQSYPGVEQVFPGTRLASPICPDNGRLTLSQTSKITTSSYVQPFTPWPLIDAAGNFVLYDMRVNPRWAAYVRDNGLDTRKGQAAFAAKGGEWDLPRGAGDTPGAIELKTSWRLLPEDESGADYFTQPVNVIVEARNSASGQAMCIDGRAALIGMHIMQKVTTPDEFAPFWIWASFEHDRNAPLAQAAPVSQENEASPLQDREPAKSCPVPGDAGDGWALFDPACTDDGKACAPNAPPKGKQFLWAATMPYAGQYLHDGRFGTQVTRCWALYDTGAEVNAAFQAALAGSVWSHYGLIGVQWANDHGDYYAEKMRPFAAPIYLVNSTMETYLQINPVLDPHGDPSTQKPSSCIMCHNLGRDTAGTKSDFSFLGGYAH